MLRRPTEILRVTINQEAKIILDREEPRMPKGERQVVLYAPASPRVLVALDIDPIAYGINKTYKFAPIPGGTGIELTLTSTQQLIALSDGAMAELAIIVTYR